MKGSPDSCDKGSNCQYVHPPMCQKSLKGQNCNSTKCHKGHFLGLRDLLSKSQSNTQTREESPQRTKQDFHMDAQAANKPNKQQKVIQNPPATPTQSTQCSPNTTGDGTPNSFNPGNAAANVFITKRQGTWEGGAQELVDIHDKIQHPNPNTQPPISLPSTPYPPPNSPITQHTTNPLFMCNSGPSPQPRSPQVSTKLSTASPVITVDSIQSTAQTVSTQTHQAPSIISISSAINAVNIQTISQLDEASSSATNVENNSLHPQTEISCLNATTVSNVLYQTQTEQSHEQSHIEKTPQKIQKNQKIKK